MSCFAYVQALVLKRRFVDHTHEFVRASPLWWVHGEDVYTALEAAGVQVAPSAAAASPAASAPLAMNATLGSVEDDFVEVEAAANMVHHTLLSGAGKARVVAAAATSDLIADMAIDRLVPPVMIVHGTADTLVPHEGE